MRDPLPMSKKERDTAHFLRLLIDGALTVGDVAKALKITNRHVYRLKERYLLDGDAGLIHGLCGHPSNNSYPQTLRLRTVELYKKCYDDYGPVLFTEKLAELYGIVPDHETVRRWLSSEKLWVPAVRGHRHRKKRERRPQIGEMTQIDGSDHDWFEQRGPRCCLFNCVEDASNLTLAYMSCTENTPSALQTLRLYFTRYGIMNSIYCDRSAVFGDHDRSTVFSRAAGRLGIEMIYAHSPQAKGRVERANRTHQDRLVKAFREENISDIDAANRFLAEVYIDKHNALFAHTEELKDIHRPIDGLDLDNLLCDEFERMVYKDMTFRLDGQYYQIVAGAGLLPIPGQNVLVRIWIDGSTHVFWKDQEIAVTPFTGRVLTKKVPPKGPEPDHPWRRKPPIGNAKRR